MRLFLLAAIAFFILSSAWARPGGSYVLTGKESSVFGIFQADTKKYTKLYEGESYNEYYNEFKRVNKLGERKLKRGETLIFPHTDASREFEKAEKAKAAKEARLVAERADAERAKQARHEAELRGEEPEEELSPLGTGKRVTQEERIARAEREKKRARHKSIEFFQCTRLRRWVYQGNDDFVGGLRENGVTALSVKAEEIVDKAFADALKLHGGSEKDLLIIEFEAPSFGAECFFAAIRADDSGFGYSLYTLEKGISFFGAGDLSVVYLTKSDGTRVKLGARPYVDLASFRKEFANGTKPRSLN